MKFDPRHSSVLRGSARAALLATALSTGFAGAQTIAVDPAGAIPATHSQVFASEWNVDGNTESWTTSQFDLEGGAPLAGVLTGTAVAELNGGTLTMDQAARRGGDSVATIKFNGTTVIAKTNKADFLPVGSAGVTSFLVTAGGAKFDSAGVAINIASQLQHDPALAAADGGLTKLGSGTLSLSNSNSYTGPTTVAAATP